MTGRKSHLSEDVLLDECRVCSPGNVQGNIVFCVSGDSDEDLVHIIVALIRLRTEHGTWVEMGGGSVGRWVLMDPGTRK